MMCRNGRYAPLIVHSFRVPAAYCAAEAQRFSCGYEDLQSVPERLRWCRLRICWMGIAGFSMTGRLTRYELLGRG